MKAMWNTGSNNSQIQGARPPEMRVSASRSSNARQTDKVTLREERAWNSVDDMLRADSPGRTGMPIHEKANSNMRVFDAPFGALSKRHPSTALLPMPTIHLSHLAANGRPLWSPVAVDGPEAPKTKTAAPTA